MRDDPASALPSPPSRSLINSPLKYKSVQKRSMDNSRLLSQSRDPEERDVEAAELAPNDGGHRHKKSLNLDLLASSNGAMIRTTDTQTLNLLNQQTAVSRDFNNYGLTNWYSTLDSTDVVKHNLSARRTTPGSKIAARLAK